MSRRTSELYGVHSDVVEFVQAGVSGIILKDATLDDFLHTIRTVAKGAKVLPAPLTDSLFSHIVEHAVQAGKVDQLIDSVRMTRREQDVIDLIALGSSNKEIATELNIAVHTVKSHVHHILEKLALHTRLELASFAHSKSLSNNNTNHLP
jgi:DNA-binding NarL/FixJ family response regulator